MNGLIHLTAAYILFAGALTLYAFSLKSRKKNVKKEIEEIKKLRT